MPFFDAHIHPTFKPYLSDGTKDIWDKIPGVSFLKSQGSMSHMKNGDVKLAVVALFPIERAFSTRVLNQIVASVFKTFDRDKLNDIMAKDYFDMIWEELKFIDTAPRKNEFKVLKKMSDFDDDKINMVFSIEGAHSLLGRRSFEDNLLKLKQSKKYRFFSMNLTHLAQAEFCNHAFGSKMFKGNDEFKPNGKGITDDGLKIIKLAHNKSKGQRILIDTKHMSLMARQQYYDLLKGKKIPILSSHAGIAGYSWSGIADQIDGACVVDDEFIEVKYKNVKGIGDTKFNPWSINLYDEDILAILESDGLIGLNLDQRIHGFGAVKGEYWSIKEFRHVVDTKKLQIRLKDFILEEPPETKAFNVKKHLRHMCNAILHVVKIGGEKAWDHLCFGSDFDGMINPLNCCQNAEEYPKLRDGLIRTLPEMIKKARKKNPNLNFHEGDIEKRVDALCFNNGFNFVKKHF